MVFESTHLSISKSDAIRKIVHTSVESFAEGFKGRHEGEFERSKWDH